MVAGVNGGSSVATSIAALATAITGVGLGFKQSRPLVIAHTCGCSSECASVDISYQPQVLAVAISIVPHLIAFVIAFSCPRSRRYRRGFVQH